MLVAPAPRVEGHRLMAITASASPASSAKATFDDLGLSAPLLQALREKGYSTPSPIQQQAIPAVLSGRDLMAAAQTGTGKTAGFTLPMLETLSHGARPGRGQIRALVLTPTRELAAQVLDNARDYSRHLRLRSEVVFGGVKINPQIQRLQQGVDLLVATPGRLLDLHQQGAVRFERVEFLVLDEADRMLDMGFIHDIRRVLSRLPERRQNLLFSATFSPSIRKLATGLLNDPLQIQITPPNQTARTVQQVVHPCDMKRKPDLLSHLIRSNDWQQVLVFSRTKHGANRVAEKLTNEGLVAAAIHGNKSQGARTRALQGFKDGSVRVLVATDIAARGIDIQQLPHVVNLDLPNVAEDYVHRIGRTGRAGECGHAISLVAAEEALLLKAIERTTRESLEKVLVPGFEPTVLEAPPLDLSGGRGRRPSRGGGQTRNHHERNRGGDGSRGGSSRSASGRPKRSGRPPQR